MNPVEVLQSYWGFDAFRPGQETVIGSVLAGKDTLAVLPTGGGKSLCYQVPALILPGLTIVVSPLIALMTDQVSALERRRIPATFLNSTLSMRETDSRWNGLIHGRYRLLYVAPETLIGDRFRVRSERLTVSLLAVDEAHCVSTWGHDFRPAYRQIPDVRPELGDPTMVALTATATPPVRRDISRGLRLRKPRIMVHGFDRPNIVWSVFSGPAREARLRDVMEAVPGAGIAYVGTRHGCERWARHLRSLGHTAQAYHAGLAASRRSEVQQAWMDGSTRVMVATSAFGMGIDRPDIRFVVHMEPPPSLEAYYQQAGRAGRDGERAHAVLLTGTRDADDRKALIETRYPAVARIRRVYDVVCDVNRLAVGSLATDPVSVDAARIADIVGCRPGEIRRCIDILEQHGAWRRAPVREGHGLLRLTTSPATWKLAGEASNWADAMLRTVSSEASHTAQWVDPTVIARRAGAPPEEAADGLNDLAARDCIRWIAPGDGELLALAGPRAPRAPLDAAALRDARRRARTHASDMERYAESSDCRRRALLAYFGESGPASCGRCDVCLGRHAPLVITPADEPALRAAWKAVGDGRDPTTDPGLAAYPPYRRNELIDWLLIEGYLRYDGPELSVTELAWPEN